MNEIVPCVADCRAHTADWAEVPRGELWPRMGSPCCSRVDVPRASLSSASLPLAAMLAWFARFAATATLWVLGCCVAPVGASSAAEPRTIAVWYAPGAPGDLAELSGLLHEAGLRVQPSASLNDLCTSDADLLLIRGTGRLGTPVRSDQWHSFSVELASRLYNRRLIGVGYEAARLFEVLGSEVRTSQMASASPEEDTVVVDMGGIAAQGGVRRTLRMSSGGGTHSLGRSQHMRVPKVAPHAAALTVVARLDSDQSLAPIVRQQNFMFFGLASDVRGWSDAYRGLWRELVTDLLSRPLSRFVPMSWEESRPGAYEFSLSPSGEASGEDERILHFLFTKAALVHIELDQEGSSDVRLYFGPARLPRLRDWDEAGGGPLRKIRIVMPITTGRLRGPPNPYWILRVSNFDMRGMAKCKLRIALESTDMRIDESTTFAMESPVVSSEVVQVLVARVRSESDAGSLFAEAALLTIGASALPMLRRAMEQAPDALYARLNWLVDRIEDS